MCFLHQNYKIQQLHISFQSLAAARPRSVTGGVCPHKLLLFLLVGAMTSQRLFIAFVLLVAAVADKAAQPPLEFYTVEESAQWQQYYSPWKGNRSAWASCRCFLGGFRVFVRFSLKPLLNMTNIVTSCIAVNIFSQKEVPILDDCTFALDLAAPARPRSFICSRSPRRHSRKPLSK